jgi:DNA-binding IclR family transcriptional regulator
MHVVATGLAYLAELDRPERERRAQSSAAAHPDLPLASAAELHAILDRFAKQGYATADQSYQAGIRGISVPIRDAAGGFICTLSVVAPTQRKSIVQLRKLAPDLQAVAQRISANVMGRRDTLAPSWPATG